MPGYDKSLIVGMADQDLDELTCGICQELFKIPFVTQCCRQTYCRTCIEEWLCQQNTCPNDRRPLQSNWLIPAPRLVLNLLNNLRIKCEYQENGCQVITTISDYEKHLKECNYKPNNNCKSCGFLQIKGEDHNCINNLLIKNNSITDEMKRLRSENQELKKYIEKSTLGMRAVLKSARNCIDHFVVEKTRDITSKQKEFLIDKTKEAVLTKDSYWTICERLNYIINKSQLCVNSKRWQAVAFSLDGGESAANCEQFFRIRFDNLVIKLFTTKDLLK